MGWEESKNLDRCDVVCFSMKPGSDTWHSGGILGMNMIYPVTDSVHRLDDSRRISDVGCDRVDMLQKP